MRVRLVSYTADGERLVAAAAKKSLTRKPLEAYASSLDEKEVEAWIRETLRRQHLSPWEHSVYTFSVEGVSRVLTHQLVRHRIASYTQLSQRYAKIRYSEKLAAMLEARGSAELTVPGYRMRLERSKGGIYRLTVDRISGEEEALVLLEVRGREMEVKDISVKGEVAEALLESFFRDAGIEGVPGKASRHAFTRHLYARFARLIDYKIPYRLVRRPSLMAGFIRLAEQALQLYLRMLEEGIPAEDARYIIPQAIGSGIIVTMNARELLHFFSLRMCTRAQWEIRALAWLMWREAFRVHPRLFKWAGPRCLIHENAVRDDPLSLEDMLGYDPASILDRIERPPSPAPKSSLVSERCPETIPRDTIPRCIHAGLSEVIEAIRLG